MNNDAMRALVQARCGGCTYKGFFPPPHTCRTDAEAIRDWGLGELLPIVTLMEEMLREEVNPYLLSIKGSLQKHRAAIESLPDGLPEEVKGDG